MKYPDDFINKIICGDCLEVMKTISDKSIDMILCDLPYGTTACEWDIIIPFDKLWGQYDRIIKENGVVILTATQPFTSMLISSNFKNFKYELIWDKNFGCSPGVAKYRPLPSHESILVFAKNKVTYNPQMGNGKAYIDKRQGDRANINGNEHKLGYKNNFNIVNLGVRFPLSVIRFQKYNMKGQHPTQKPVALFQYLIKTYTNEGDVVLDNCAGSGTTAVAAKYINRKFICIEKEQKYVDIAKKRIRQKCLFN